ncbi:MAG: YdcF family protein [Clostridiales bacterium]|nr:YdcF family protein [Clostridiales bacterium]
MKKANKIIVGILRGIVLFVALIMAVTAVINAIVVCSARPHISDYDDFEGTYDYIIVLGCGIIDNSIPTDLMVDRLDTAVRLYEDGAAPRILLSGDHQVEDYNEVAVMRNYIISEGVPEDAIVCDDLGLSTNETMRRAAGLYDVKSAVIVTQEYHLYRAVYLAVNYGIRCEGVIATGHTFVNQAYYSAREVLARVKDFFVCIVY